MNKKKKRIDREKEKAKADAVSRKYKDRMRYGLFSYTPYSVGEINTYNVEKKA